ncbi:hypothetical protein SKAU_G00106950 [Synaphobranchus kaupii]|uniref:Uncharacterized protein n=1 Tax=Synaphobranchus kaupii TaxID=118154 RepID=A0A9Q1J6X8_SYNKA|nr:hypothetical protein SKAU_G00106950 [Synaphobranchus kaupii]
MWDEAARLESHIADANKETDQARRSLRLQIWQGVVRNFITRDRAGGATSGQGVGLEAHLFLFEARPRVLPRTDTKPSDGATGARWHAQGVPGEIALVAAVTAVELAAPAGAVRSPLTPPLILAGTGSTCQHGSLAKLRMPCR